ncbi:hypothetical protein CLAVI_000587 [Candidatus Clavichlamydia salmonicola]|uniref:hypothetical protein n=1 Tax=Candidatus Clavichlamydia salmonicola TaxID=469812 RepID=UPI001891ADBF|nr:hypothetical protein [Candidatus Clavichlamydia salmonicola]MBF5050964.1 hypothetical protein [Candidatus Clavichlamydia salmonicola]
MYGVFSAVKFSLALANKGIRLCVERGLVNLDEDEEERLINRSIADMLVALFPEVLAGFLGMNYACVIIVKFMENLSVHWRVINSILGVLSCGLYVLDVSLACFDMISLDLEEREARIAWEEGFLGRGLGFPRFSGGNREEISMVPLSSFSPQYGEVMAMRQMPSSQPQVFSRSGGEVIRNILVVMPLPGYNDVCDQGDAGPLLGPGLIGEIVVMAPPYVR